MWIFEFLLGMFLAYVILSPRLRKLIFHHNRKTQSMEQRVEAEEKRENDTFTQRASPANQSAMPLNKHESVNLKDEEALNELLRNNPELRKMNNLR